MGASQPSSSRTFPTYVLGLLTALEASPVATSTGLQQTSNSAPSGFATPNGNNLDRPAETDAIHASIGRLAERLAKAESLIPTNSTALSNGFQKPATSSAPTSTKSRHASNAPPFSSAILQDLVNGGPPNPYDEGPRSSAEEELGQLKDQVKDFARVYVILCH